MTFLSNFLVLYGRAPSALNGCDSSVRWDAHVSDGIQDTIKQLWDFRERLSEETRSRLTLRIHNAIPSASAIMLDADEK